MVNTTQAKFLGQKMGTLNDKGYFATPSALTTAYPVGQVGWFAEVGSTDTIWIWDDLTVAWVDSGLNSLNTWKLNGNTLGVKKTLGSIDNYDIGFITNNTERLTITNGGYVGIGTTSPVALLHTYQTSTGAFDGLLIQKADSTTGNEARINFTLSSSSPNLAADTVYGGRIGVIRQGANGLSDMYFSTSDNTGVVQKRIYIKNNGNVGIGTTAPSFTLQLYNATKSYFAIYTAESKNTAFSFQQGNGNGTTGNNSFFMGIDGNASDNNFGYGGGTNDILMATYYGSAFRNLLRFPIGTQNAIFYGNVGIGTTNPNALLEVSKLTGSATISPSIIRISTQTNASDWDTTNTWGQLEFYSADTTGAGARVHSKIGVTPYSSTGAHSRLGFFMDNAGVISEAMSIIHTGNVGIGTTTPTSTLHSGGSFAGAYRAISANRTLDATDYVIDCTANTFTVTLPTAVNIVGRQYIIKNSGTGIITINTTSSQTIDGDLTRTLSVQYGFIKLFSDGANWKVIS